MAPDADPQSSGVELFRVGEPGDRMQSVVHALGLLVGAFLVGSLLVGVAGDLLATAGLTEVTAPVAVSTVRLSANFVGFLLVGVGYLHWRGDRSLISVRSPTRRDVAWIAAGSVALAVVVNALGFLATVAGLETATNVVVDLGRENPELFVVLVPIQFLLTAPAEELLFRGLLQGLFRPAYGSVPAVLVASALFGLVHYPALAGSEGVAVVIAILIVTGLLLGGIYEYTRNLLVPIVVHAVWNAFLFLALYVQVA